MRIAILSRGPKLYSTRRLVEAARERGHSARIINHLRCYMNITADQPVIHYQGKELTKYHAVIPRIGASVTAYGTAVVRQFEMMGTHTLNHNTAIICSRDKFRVMQLLTKKGIALPTTGFAHSAGDVKDLINTVGGAPFVIKLPEGALGAGVALAETQNAAESVLMAFMGINADILIQEFIQESRGKDVRCFVIGDDVVAAMERRSANNDFRSNIHRGGTGKKVRITKELKNTALAAARAVGLSVCGVDVLRSDRGPMVLEVNSSPGLQGIETVTGIDIAGHIIEHLEQHVSNKNSGKQKDDE